MDTARHAVQQDESSPRKSLLLSRNLTYGPDAQQLSLEVKQCTRRSCVSAVLQKTETPPPALSVTQNNPARRHVQVRFEPLGRPLLVTARILCWTAAVGTAGNHGAAPQVQHLEGFLGQRLPCAWGYLSASLLCILVHVAVSGVAVCLSNADDLAPRSLRDCTKPRIHPCCALSVSCSSRSEPYSVRPTYVAWLQHPYPCSARLAAVCAGFPPARWPPTTYACCPRRAIQLCGPHTLLDPCTVEVQWLAS
mmetsp:Transcript_14495/g.49839  ORF Transcript_14495/g.49839 Transcript_14495/m.49839 type:complete len:250 (+) Transcript_14495:1218-1967(+)